MYKTSYSTFMYCAISYIHIATYFKSSNMRHAPRALMVDLKDEPPVSYKLFWDNNFDKV